MRALRFVVLATCAAALIAPSASARNPGGRDYGGAIFSAGVSGVDGPNASFPRPLTPALDAIVRVSDDSGLPDTLAPWELNQSGRTFINSETEPWVAINPADPSNMVGMFQEDRWSTGGARGLTFAYSKDGGKTWSAPITLKKEDDFAFFNDRNSLAVDDFASSPFYGSVYVGWDRLASKGPGYAYTGDGLVAYSRDGFHYTTVTAVPTGNNEQTLTNLPVVEPNGDVVLVGTYYQNQSFNKNGGKFFVTRSADGGVSWAPVEFPFDQRPVGVPNLRVGDGVPNAAVDPRNGKLYAVWEDSRFSGGKRDDILLVSSTDEGRTWTSPIKVNDTPAGAQGAFTPTVKVDANGRVAVLYYDLRNDTNDRDSSYITTEWIAYSTNGGRSFGASRRIGPDFDHAAAAFARGFFLGDYQGLGVTGTTFVPFFGATYLPQADGRIGSDIFATRRN